MRFRALDAWRGTCALMIAVLHFCLQEWPYPCGFCASSFIGSSYLFVDFFFVLSGFVIGHAYGERLASRADFAAFVLRRFGRLWPLHVATLFMVAAVRLLAPLLTRGEMAPLPMTGRQSVASFAMDVVMLRPLGMAALDPAYHLDWNYPSWSIAVEMATCLLFGLACVLIPVRALLHAVEAVVMTGSALLLYAVLGQMDATDDYGLLRCLYGFLLGRLLYEAFRRLRLGTLPAASAIEAMTVTAVIGCMWAAGRSSWSLLAPLLFAAAIFVFAHEAGAISRLLQARVPQLLGTLSYSIYMVHVFVYEVALRLALPGLRWLGRVFSVSLDPGPSIGQGLELALAMTAVLAMSALTYAVVEQPGRRAFNALADGYRRRAGGSAEPAISRP